MEAQKAPVIIPMWLTGLSTRITRSYYALIVVAGIGFDKLMPEGRPFPYKFLPRPGAALSVTFGKPVPAQDIQDTLAMLVQQRRMPDLPQSLIGVPASPSRSLEEELSGDVTQHGWLGATLSHVMQAEVLPESAAEIARVRSAVTAVIQRDVEALGRSVLGLQR